LGLAKTVGLQILTR